VQADRLAQILQCPKCRASLPSSSACAGCGADYPTSRGQPVLIDFDKSIFKPEAYCEANEAPLPERGSAVGRMLRRLTYGESTNTRRAIARFIGLLRGKRPRVLVIGGGTVGSGTDALYADPAIELIGTDIYATDHTHLLCDAHQLPFKDASFDGILIQAVLEHVLEPQTVVDEVHRVLKPNGLVLAETPFMQQVHLGAYDFTRFTHAGHRWLFRRFEQIEAGADLGPGVALTWSIAHMARSVGLGAKGAALLTAPFFWLRFLDKFAARGLALDGASGLYFMGRRSEVTLKPADMPAYYEANR
jgi:SAM-dependent methyltransferase